VGRAAALASGDESLEPQPTAISTSTAQSFICAVYAYGEFATPGDGDVQSFQSADAMFVS
jgi:hypothetical protein